MYISIIRGGPLNNTQSREVVGPGADGARDGCAKQLADLASDHHRALLRFLTARTGSREEAREVAQEAYAKILALDKPETIGLLVGYLWRTAGNLAAERRRTRAARARLDVVGLFNAEDQAPSAEALVCAEQRLALLQKAIEGLPPRYSEAFMLRVIEERSFKEVAERMNVSVRWAMESVARALKHCQDYLDAAEAAARVPG
jgi:RNA polymerase sigma-70 factor (ECF subfamily)